MKLLLYGLQRSGTNYLERVIARKFKVKFLNNKTDRSNPLHKHFRIYDNKDIIPEPKYKNNIDIENIEQFEKLIGDQVNYYLVISKDPYSWLQSYQNWAEQCNWPENEHHYIEEYNLFYGKWLDFSNCKTNVIFIRYIDLLKDLDSELNRLKRIMGLRKRLFAKIFPNRGRIIKVSQSSKFTESRRNYYINKKYLEMYSDNEIEDINKKLDSEIIESLGYELQKP